MIRRFIARLTHPDSRMTILFFTLLLTITVGPILHFISFGNIALALAFTMLLVVAVDAIGDRKLHTVFGVILAVPLLVGFWLNQVAPGTLGSEMVGISWGVPFFVYTLYRVLKYVVKPGPVTGDKLAGAASAYLLIGYTWGGLYGAIEHFWPGSFAFSENALLFGGVNWEDFTYLSFVTLTTLGYGDITPVLPIARSLTMLESISGVLYIAFIISSLVGGLRYRSAPVSKGDM